MFFLTLQLLQLQAAAQNRSANHLVLEVSAALLDRVFETARVDAVTGKAPIETSHEEARGLAAAVLPEMSSQFGDRVLAVRGQRLAQLQAERLRLAGVELTRQPPTAVRNLAEDFGLPWSDVLARMAKSNGEKAVAYFRRNDTLRGVFVRSVTTRPAATPPQAGPGHRPPSGSGSRRTR